MGAYDKFDVSIAVIDRRFAFSFSFRTSAARVRRGVSIATIVPRVCRVYRLGTVIKLREGGPRRTRARVCVSGKPCDCR